MRNNESEEMYLETIYVLQKELTEIRSVDIARQLGYSKPSVCVAMKRLKEKEFITIDEQGVITLTESGRKAAAGVYERHHLLTKFFMGIGAAPGVAEENACRIEHVISAELLETMRTFMGRETAACD